MDLNSIKVELKNMIIEECEKDHITPEEIKDDVELFSEESGLELDSLDALQISIGLQNRYGIRITDPKEFRRHVTTIEKLAQFIVERHG
ncbi:phosphopantetheine-binding protein [Hydrogenimonas thermophila]|uniref:acyl carrier protein n=1 Tax=Hydrogenimonas thermophila TaxID=223786 RepID=UPI00293742F8|nr:phosphopantetheine-binding protein [Hydrogenimonas thermophila]WOE69603.1 phosphopantetheine-binding protein [Hydrogenimonas thermophila]WOE72117.1 phosphopantetheine-binding protein [Hydrogenimonas thermophila]